MKLVILFATLYAALGDVTSNRLRAKTLPGVLSLLQEEPSDSTQNATVVAAAPDQINIADEKAVPVAALADKAVETVATDADASADDSADDVDGETAELVAEDKADEADANKDLPAVVTDEADADAAEETANATSIAKPVFDVDQIERSLINLRKTEGEASPGMMKFVEKVTKLIADMEVKVVDAGKKDQSLLYDYRNQFTKCRKGSTRAQSGINSLKIAKQRAATGHRSCRYVERKAFQVRDRCDELLVSKKETKDASCGALRDLNRNPNSEANNCHPAHSEKFPIWLRRNEAWFRFKRVEYQKALRKCQIATVAVKRQIPICNSKTRNHLVMKAVCDVKQGTLETKACGLGKSMSSACHKYSNCWEDTKEDYEKAKPGIRNMERDRKGEWRVLKRVKCLLDVFSEKDGMVDAKVIGECKEKTHSTTHLNLFYPPIPPKIKCAAIPPVPGQNRFVQAFYSSLPFDAKAGPSETCVVEAGGGLVLGRPKGTTANKCSVRGSSLTARNGASCYLSNERRKRVSVDYSQAKYTTYKFKMAFKGNTADRNNNPWGGIRFCNAGTSSSLTFGDMAANNRWGWSLRNTRGQQWSRYTNKNDRRTGAKGYASPYGNKVMNMEVTLYRVNANQYRLYAWKVNGAQLRSYNNYVMCTSRANQVPVVWASSGSIQISDFKVYQGSNAVMAMPQIVGEGVPRAQFTVRCARRSTQAVGNRVPGTGSRVVANALECQDLCASYSGCVEFSFSKNMRCETFWRVTRRIRRAGGISGPAACERPYRTGLKAEFYFFNRHIHRMPNLAFRKPDQTRTDLSVKYISTTAAWPGVRRNQQFVARWTGSLFIKTQGWYYFWTTSDDGSFLWIDGNSVVSNGGLHGMRTHGKRIHLKPGWHRIQMMMFENHGAAGAYLRYNGPDTMHHTVFIPTEVMRPEDRASRGKRVSVFGTPDDKKLYKFPMQSRLLRKGSESTLLVTVRSSNDAHIELYKDLIGNNPSRLPKNSYEIVLGGWSNGRSAIRVGPVGNPKAFPYTKNIVTKDEYRQFWIVVDTKKKQVRVGKGHDTTKYEFMKVSDSNVFTPRSFAVMTGWGGTAEWVFNTPQRKAPTKARLGRSAWFLGDTGKDCTDTCANEGRVCDSDIRSGYSYSKFREFVKKDMGASCVKDTRAWWGQDQPCFVAGGPDGNQGKCLASRNIPTRVKCSGKHPKVMRWCKCSASTNVFSVINAGRRTWDSMVALAKTKGGRLMTLDEARLVLKRRGMRPFLRNRDAWAAVTNEASSCKDKMDWIQIGNRGHWTGKSHFEYHGCASWANSRSRGHWDSGYLMMAKARNAKKRR